MAVKKNPVARKAPKRSSRAEPVSRRTARSPRSKPKKDKENRNHAYGKCSYSYGSTPSQWPQHGYDPRSDSPPPKGPVFQPGRFGRMFPDLPGLVVPDEALKALGEAMLDGDDDLSRDNAKIPAGFTYLGQFIDHDITFDPTTMPEVLVDPQATFNFRTPKLDLDSVYGTGPATQPYLYESDRLRLRLGATQTGFGDPTIPAGKPNDLLRLNNTAVTGDPRNDENLVVAQTHIAFIKFHNRCVEKLQADGFPASGLFLEARKLATWHYQRMVIDDFLARLCSPAVLADVVANGPSFFEFTTSGEAFMPVEFSVAAYRFGHSQVRNQYDYNRVFRQGGVTPATLNLLFQFTAGGGGAPVPSDWIIDWRRFYNIDTAVTPDPTRRIDPFLASALHNAMPGGGEPLSVRNLKRGVRMGLPSGQAVAAVMEIPALTAAELSSGPDGQVLAAQGLATATPLWFYILKEAQVQQNGERLGEVGSRIVAETFIGLLDSDAMSVRRQNPSFTPTLFNTATPPALPGKYTMVDLLRFVDDINPIGD